VEIIFIIVGFAVVFGASIWSRHRQRSNWRTVAQEFGLDYVDGGWFGNPSIYGNYRGAKVSVETEIRGSGKSSKAYTVVQASLSGRTPMDLEMYREGFMQRVGKAIGGADIQVGDPQLDNTFIIKGTDRAKIRELLTNPAVKARLLSSQNQYSTFGLDMGNVNISESGRTGNMDQLRGCIRTVVSAANVMNEACAAKPNPAGQAPVTTQANQPAPPQDFAPPAKEPAPFGPQSASDPPAADSDPEPDSAASNEDDWW
jgi:hypothetical protein